MADEDYYSPFVKPAAGGISYQMHLVVSESSQNSDLNTSTLDWELLLEKDSNGNGFTGANATWSVTLNGTVVASATGTPNPTSLQSWPDFDAISIASSDDYGQFVVIHEDDGTMTIPVVAHYGSTGTGVYPGSMDITDSLELDTIDRSTVPIIDASPAVVGDTVTIDTSDRADPSFTHDITYESGALSGTIATGVTDGTSFAMPDVSSQFPGDSLYPINIITTTKLFGLPIGVQLGTIFARATRPPTVTEDHNELSQFDIRARRVEWNTTTSAWEQTDILADLGIKLVENASATATLDLKLSRLTEGPQLDDYSVVDVEVWDPAADGGLGNWIFTDHRFYLTRIEDDQLDSTKVNSYSGVEFVDYELSVCLPQKAHVWKGTKTVAPSKKDPIGSNPVTSPGDIMQAFLRGGKSRGWGPRMSWSFTESKTSLKTSWKNKDVDLSVDPGTPASQILSGMVDDGQVEYKTKYESSLAKLILMNPGTGSDFAATGAQPVVNLALLPMDTAPRRGTTEARVTRVTAQGDDKAKATREVAPFDPHVFGQIEGWVSASGVKKNSTAAKIATASLKDSKTTTEERSFTYKAANATRTYFPFVVFRTGDWILIPDRSTDSDASSTIRDRIAQITIDKTTDQTTISITTGDRILSGVAKLAKRQSATVGDSIAGGTGTALDPVSSKIPAPPNSVFIQGEGYWNSDGAAKSRVILTWPAVKLTTAGDPDKITNYEVWDRPSGEGEFSLEGLSSTNTLTIPGYDVQKSYDFRVRAQDSAGTWSDFSADQPFTTVAPAVDLSGPQIADLYTDGVGGIYVVWAGLLDPSGGTAGYGLGGYGIGGYGSGGGGYGVAGYGTGGYGTDPLTGDLAPNYLAYVTAEISSDGGTSYKTDGTPIVAAGTIVINTNGEWGDYYVRLRAYDRLGQPGDVSEPQLITLSDPHVVAPQPNAPDGLTVNPGASWDNNGILPEAWFDLSWNPPSEDVSGNPVSIVGYDLLGLKSTETIERYLTTSATPSVRWTVGQGETWTFRVRATSIYGGVSQPSEPIIATADGALEVAPDPDAPTLDQYAGILRIKWSGGGILPQVKYVYAQISSDGNDPFTRAGMPLLGAGEVVVPGLAPGLYWAQIVMVDELGNTSTSTTAGPINLLPPTGLTIQTNEAAHTGIKLTDGGLTSYDATGRPTFIINAATGEVWIAPYDAVFDLGAAGVEASTGNPTTGISISSDDSSFNTFVHPTGVEIRRDQTPLSWWEADVSDANLVNFFSPRAVIGSRLRILDYEMLGENKATGTRLVIRYKGA